MTWDAIIVGAGPAGSACAALCSAAGVNVLLLEREAFPREKVCGDCLNRDSWPVLEELGVAGRVRATAHACVTEVEIGVISGEIFRYRAPHGSQGEIAVKRLLFDDILAKRAGELGASVQQGVAVSKIERDGEVWRITAGDEAHTCRFLVAADGRNSTVARLAGVLPSPKRSRVAIQAHLPCPAGHETKVALQLLPKGYCGAAGVGGNQLNVCLVSRPEDLPELKMWAAGKFGCDVRTEWRSVAPLERAPVAPLQNQLILVGDAARVVEPFTGEGIYYALASGRLAAQFLTRDIGREEFLRNYNRLYSGRLWVNRVAKLAVTHPQAATQILKSVPYAPALLRRLTAKVIGASDGPA